MNILWAMDGVDLNLNTDISKHLADLGQTLTTLTSEEGLVDGYNDGDNSSSLSTTDSEQDGEESVSLLILAICIGAKAIYSCRTTVVLVLAKFIFILGCFAFSKIT